MDRVSPIDQPSATAAAAVVRKNPYVGPRSLRYGEAIYGRDREARQLLELLIAERIVLLYSPSGAGKTSLIQAGLIPELEKEEFHVLPVIRVSRGSGDGVFPCNPYVFSALLSLEQGMPPEQAIPAEELASMPFGEYLKRRETAVESDDGTFLVFDQFEEILTIDPMNREAKMDFFNQVGDALRDLKRWALFSMREDHVAALDPYLRPVPTRLKSTFRLDLLTAECARVAVQRPAQECGVEFSEEATTKLVDDLRQVAVQGPAGETEIQPGPYVEPVQLQVVCYRLWDKLPSQVPRITEEHVVGTGDVDSALADYYSERVAQIAGKCGVKERVLREWFDRRLITESGIRSQVMVGAENSKEISEAAVQALVDVHLIRGEERRGVIWLELAHDRLVKPIRADNAKWWERNLSVLQHQAAVWNNQGRSDALCLRGEARRQAKQWAEEHTAELTGTEREFMEVCQRNHDARTNKWAGWAALALTILLTGISVLTFYALRQARIATARLIAARAHQFREERLDLALLLATEAQRISDQQETRGTLLTTAYYNSRLSAYLIGPGQPVQAVAFSADGATLATGDFSGRVVLWDAKTHRPIQQWLGLVKDAVRSIVFSRDGSKMAVSSKGRQVALRDLRTGQVRDLPAAQAHQADVWALAFSRDSTLLASGAADGRVVVWDTVSGEAVTLAQGGSKVRGLGFDPAGMLLAAGRSDGSITLWSRQGGMWTPVSREFEATHARFFAPEADAETRQKRMEADEKWKAIRCLATSPDGKYLVVGRESGSVDLYDFANEAPRVEVAALGRHDNKVSGLAFSPKSDRLITSSFDGTLRLWKVPTMEQVGPPFTGHVDRVLCVAFSSDEKMVASGGTDRRAILWNTWMHVAETARAETMDAPFSVAFSPDARWEANGYSGGSVLLLRRDLAKWADYVPREVIAVSENPEHVKFVPIVTFSGDSRRAAATTPEGHLRVFDLTNISADQRPAVASEIDVLAGQPRKITAVGMATDGSIVAVAVAQPNRPAELLAWRLPSGERVLENLAHQLVDNVVSAVEFSPDGQRLVTGGDAQGAVIWHIANPAHPTSLKCPEEHTGTIRSIAFRPDGKLFATASGDNTLLLWDAVTGKRAGLPLTGHRAPVLIAAFSPDGKVLASGSDDHSVFLWDVGTKQGTGRLTGHSDSVRALAFSPDSKRLYTSSWGEEAQEWELDPEALQKKCGERANRNLESDEWDTYIGSGASRVTWPRLPPAKQELSTIPTSER